VANQRYQPVKAKPITSNPLFPAFIALWFGALFGLGSLAVRPALLEQLVLSSHIDLIIPAAAPPLGVTARILLALAMAALGGILGILLTRQLTRPEPDAYNRKRDAKDPTTQTRRVRARDAHPDAPARRPISAHEELGSETTVAVDRTLTNGPGLLANRRRALAIIRDVPHFVPHGLAPLPGSGAIQPLDLPALALPDEPAQLQTAVTPAAVPLDWPQPAPVAGQELADAPTTMGGPPHQPFQPDPLPPLAIEPVLAEGDHLPQDLVRTSGVQTSVFDTPTASPLFDRAAPEPVPVVAAAADARSTTPKPSTATLGITDLAARLAEAMRRRRELSQLPVAGIAASPAGAVVQHDDQPADDDHLTDDNADNADNPYASLLVVAPQRQTLVQIDELPVDTHEAGEPVVIFPGQAPHVAALASAGHGQPIAANSASATADPAEIAQALRAALSNLQRMSGAA
jgi:hypothetical protein